MQGILEEAARRHIKCLSVASRDELLTKAASYSEPSSLVLFLSTYKEFESSLQEYSDITMPVIIFAHNIYDTCSTEFSYVMSDASSAMRQAVSHLKEQGAARLALFSVNTKSNYDVCRLETFKHITDNESPIVFTRTHGLKSCITQLLSCKEKIDGLICTNDLEALKLMHVLNALDADWNSKMLLLGSNDTALSSIHHIPLTSTTLNYFECGKEIVSLHLHISKNPEIAHSHTVIKSKLQKRSSTSKANPCGICFSDYTPPSDEYLSKLLCASDKLMTLENIISTSNQPILKLLFGILEDKTINQIADELYFSRDNVLYHLRKIRQALHVNNTEELRNLLSRWIDADALDRYI